MNTTKREDFESFIISICRVNIRVKINPKFTSIKRLFSSITIPENSTFNNTPCVIITESSTRDIVLNEDWTELVIMGPSIDNLKDPFNHIGILQAVFRFISLVGLKNNIALLHGSTVVFEGKTLQFGDDGFSTAKTLSSIECAIHSQKYVCDEFSFINLDSKIIPGLDFVPVHIRDIVNDYLEKQYSQRHISDTFEQSTAGVFLSPDKLFKEILKKAKLDIVIYTHFIDHGEPFYKKLDEKQAFKAMQTNMLAHIMKLLYPSLDRMQFKVTNDTDKRVIYNDTFLEELTDKLKLRETIMSLSQSVPSYQIYITNPNQITKTLQKIINK